MSNRHIQGFFHFSTLFLLSLEKLLYLCTLNPCGDIHAIHIDILIFIHYTEDMEEQNHIDKALAFMQSLEKLGAQLKAAEEHQKQMLAQMLSWKKEGKTDSEEYATLQQRSKGLQDLIDKWRPIYQERMEMVRDVQKHGLQKRKRSKKK